MKKLIIMGALCFAVRAMSGQNVAPSSLYIQHESNSLLLNNADSSWLFNAYVLTQELGGISSVTLSCQNFSVNAWVPVKDTVYTWSLVLNDTLASSTVYEVCKPNDNILKICLGRLYYSGRHRFTFSVTGVNGILTKEFSF